VCQSPVSSRLVHAPGDVTRGHLRDRGQSRLVGAWCSLHARRSPSSRQRGGQRPARHRQVCLSICLPYFARWCISTQLISAFQAIIHCSAAVGWLCDWKGIRPVKNPALKDYQLDDPAWNNFGKVGRLNKKQKYVHILVICLCRFRSLRKLSFVDATRIAVWGKVRLRTMMSYLLDIITLRASRGAVYCNRSCLWVLAVFVCLFVCLWLCCHDNSKLRASILTKLGL